MLRTLPQLGCLVQRNMPVDFATYLLSSSPPASSFELLSSTASNRSEWLPFGRNNFINYQKTVEEKIKSSEQDDEPLKPIITRNFGSNCSTEDEDGCSTCSSGRESPQPPSPGRTKKKVSFADHKGLALATVKIMTEPSDVPPRLRPEILASITQGASAGVTEQPPLVLSFKQPASDYLTFRDKLEKQNLSLENVIIRDYILLGTIKVKNISFEKKVFLRGTFDSWETHVDVPATYVSGPQESGQIYDTFSFEFGVPAKFDSNKKIEFAVCYETEKEQYWDNNNGNNYLIVSANMMSCDSNVIKPISDLSTLRNVPCWSEYAPWNNVDTSLPYW